jgi:Mg2+/Co2+ transporter CorB
MVKRYSCSKDEYDRWTKDIIHQVSVENIMVKRYSCSKDEYDRWTKDIIHQVSEMFKDRIILHCDSCDHEADAALGEKCSWCGGNMRATL